MSGTLAIDTASRIVAVAFAAADELRIRTSDDETPEHSRRIIQLIDEVTDGDLTGISGIVVTQGPGSFTGLRIGIATAQSLGFALGIPVVGVPTLRLVAGAVAGDDILAVHPAGRGEFAAQRFVAGVAQGDLFLAQAEALDHMAIVGEGAEALGKREVLPAERVAVAVGFDIPSGSGPSVEPIYARAPNITQPREPFAKSNA
jgi:tRNA threonylcarbamoyladenosine biosynthesis protein TsaB